MHSAAASHRQLRSASRQSAASEHSRASGRLSTHSHPVVDLLVELMRSVFDNQRADAAAQRTNADRREQQLRAEIVRREKEMADKVRLQLRV